MAEQRYIGTQTVGLVSFPGSPLCAVSLGTRLKLTTDVTFQNSCLDMEVVILNIT